MGNADTEMQQGVHFTVIHVHTMSRKHFRIEQILFFHIRNDRHLIFTAHILHFNGGLRDVGMQRHIKLDGKGSGGF